jgi:signal transduction histidine kinase/CHASE1-domain containing sensor protein/ActR/RegA family two-component response regulator
MSVVGGLRRFSFPLTVFVVGVLATALVTVQMRRAAAVQDEERFEVAVDRLQDSIEDRLRLYIAMLRAGAGLLAATDVQSPDQFHAFVERLAIPRRYPGVQGIGYTERIAQGEVAQVVALQRSRGRPDFHVWPENPRAEYHSILYLEPLDRRNQAAIGYDMFTDPTRRAAMERARDTGEPAASGLVTLVQEIDEVKQPGFLIYMPVYRGGTVPPTLEERRRLLRGFVYSPFRAGDLFTGILGRNPRPRAGVALFDGVPSEGALIHRTATQGGAGRMSATRTITVAGREWTAELFSTPALDRGSSGSLIPLVWLGGGAITLLLTWLAALQTRARQQAEQAEAASAETLARYQQLADSLGEQTETLEIVNRTGAQLAGELDLDRLLQAVTDAGTKLTRAQFGAFFYNVTNLEGEAYTLYTLSGVPRSAFQSLPMPRNTAVFGPTFRGEGIVRSGDITADARYGQSAPHDGMPPGHPPVRSYLAAPVKSRSGEVLGGLFFGHAERDVFTEQSEHIVGGIAAQAAIAIDNARLYGQVQQLLASERSARSEAERVSRLKDEFLATLSHELRTPLNAVVGWAHMLNAGTLTDAKRVTAVETILRNARIQSQLIEDLLDMSRIISGRTRIDPAVLDLDEVVSAALDVVRPTAAAKRIELMLMSDAAAHVVKGDSNRLQQIVWNLLTNAVKFTPPGGRVTVAVERCAESVQIVVSDTGVGIDASFLPYVFERFRQADGSVTRGHGGLGLGLAIVKSLVEMHGGSIRAASDGPNRGATFTARLPAASVDDFRSAGLPDAPSSRRADTQALQALSILVVDDDADAGDLASEILTQSGARVMVARSGAEALRRLHAQEAVQLIVSDLGMPNMDGYELMQRVRTLPVEMGGAAPAIALTAYAGAEDRARAIAAGYALHLAKPYKPEELVSACTLLAREDRV